MVRIKIDDLEFAEDGYSDFDLEYLEGMIVRFGILTTPVAYKTEDEKYKVLAGAEWIAAAKTLNEKIGNSETVSVIQAVDCIVVAKPEVIEDEFEIIEACRYQCHPDKENQIIHYYNEWNEIRTNDKPAKRYLSKYLETVFRRRNITNELYMKDPDSFVKINLKPQNEYIRFFVDPGITNYEIKEAVRSHKEKIGE